MKFDLWNLRSKERRARDIADKYRPPETIGKPPEKQKIDDAAACFKPVETMLRHSAELLGSEGMPVFPGYAMLSGLAQNGLIRSGVEMRAKEMTRKWGEVVTAGEDEEKRAEAMNRRLEDIGAKNLFRQIAEKCGFMGGCLVFIDTGEDRKELVNPLILDGKILKGKLKGFRIIDPWTCWPGLYNSIDPLAEDYFNPSLWYVQGTPISSTRLIRVVENELPEMIRPAYNFFGLSLTQKVLDAVSHFTRNRESASKLLEKISLVVLKTDMSDILSGGSDADVRMRAQYFANNWDFDGVAMIDKDSEELAIFNNTISGVVDIVRQSMEYVAAMFNEPATKLWGISPAGMNATGESDMQNHYDNIASLQEQLLAAPMKRVLDVLQLDMYGNVDRDLKFQFAPLSEKSDRAVAELNKMKAETADIYVAMGAVGAEEVRNTLIKDPDSGYTGLPEYAPLPEHDPEEVRIDV